MLIVVCTCISIERSTVALSFLFEITRLYGGYYTSPRQLDRFPEWRFADALSYIKYAYIGVALNELEGLKYDCDTDESCIYRTGEQQIEAMGYGEYTKASCVAYLIMLIASFRFLGYLGLRFLKG